jgi:hypothetical protein
MILHLRKNSHPRGYEFRSSGGTDTSFYIRFTSHPDEIELLILRLSIFQVEVDFNK